ncbi:hypothetical protein [Lysobacter sp. 22409]|uniref:hypothetical protein n=1 Tax=Lysobacter sp. 22409 TaxID=3453917 RepID=UPI003F852E96
MEKSDLKPKEDVSTLQFIGTEGGIFLASVASLYLLIWLSTNQLSTEESVNRVLMSKLQGNTVSDLGYTILALFIVYSPIGLALRYKRGGMIYRIADAIIDELPRTIYFFGANLTAVSLAGCIYLQATNDAASGKFLGFAVFFAATFFSGGCFLKSVLKAASEHEARQRAT